VEMRGEYAGGVLVWAFFLVVNRDGGTKGSELRYKWRCGIE
jgi:hypothetical protein